MIISMLKTKLGAIEMSTIMRWLLIIAVVAAVLIYLTFTLKPSLFEGGSKLIGFIE